jgi:hypothetical protein
MRWDNEHDSTDKMEKLNVCPANLHKQMLRHTDMGIVTFFRHIH